MLDYAIGAMLRARFTCSEIERAVTFRIESGGSLENAVLADWQRIDPPSMSSVLGGRQAAAVPPDFEVLGDRHRNGGSRARSFDASALARDIHPWRPPRGGAWRLTRHHYWAHPNWPG
jgi:hypothetical protein